MQDFSDKLSERIITLLESKPYTLTQLVTILPEHTAENLFETIDSLFQAGKIVRENTGAFYLKAPATYRYSYGQLDHFHQSFYRLQQKLPLPHALDSDWRFTFNGVCQIVSRCSHLLSEESKVVCLGCPSIGALLGLIGGLKHILIVDTNDRLLNQIRQILPHIDDRKWDVLEDPVHKGDIEKYDLVFADPPAYQAYYETFISKASLLLRNHGHFVLTVLPRYHFSNEITERSSIFHILSNNNLVPSLVLEDLVGYERIPNVEEMTKPIEDIKLLDWRRGDLVVCYKAQSWKKRTSAFTPQPNIPKWENIFSGRSSIRLRLKIEEDEQIAIEKIGIYEPISRFSNLAQEVDLWTSGGQLYRVKNYGVVSQVIKTMIHFESGETVFNILKSNIGDAYWKDLQEVINEIEQLLDRERNWDNWLRELSPYSF